MKRKRTESRAGGHELMACLAGAFTVVGVAVWIVIATEHQSDSLAIQLGFEWFLQTVGTLAAGIGLLGLVLEALARRRPDRVLSFALLLTAGLAVYMRTGWAVIGVALVVALFLAQEYIALESRRHEDASDGGGGDASEDENS